MSITYPADMNQKQIDQFIRAVVTMRTHQKNFFKAADKNERREHFRSSLKAEALVDDMIRFYNAGQIDMFDQHPRQINPDQ